MADARLGDLRVSAPRAFAQTLSWRHWVPLFCRAYLVITLLAGILYLGGRGMIVGFELPARFPEAYRPEIREAFMSQPDGITRAWLLTEGSAAWGLLAVTLAVVLAAGLVGGLAAGLAFSVPTGATA